jgi:hypothetical protein
MGVSTKITPIRGNGGYAMTSNKCKGGRINPQEIFGVGRDGLKELLREVLQEVLEQAISAIWYIGTKAKVLEGIICWEVLMIILRAKTLTGEDVIGKWRRLS